jgi:hypothetical protein
MTVTMSTTLIAVLKCGRLLRDHLGSTERTFLKRWVEGWADDPIWAEIVADASALGCWPKKTLNSQLIWYALDAKRISVSVKSGVDPIFLEEQQQRAKLLALADNADELARYFVDAEKHIGIAEFFHLNLSLPVTREQEAVPRTESVFLRVQQLRTLHEKEALLLRKRAGREPKPRTFMSRNKSKLEVNAFIHSMIRYIEDFCGKRSNEAVAVLASIAFNSTIDAEQVRLTLRPSTRKSRALNRKNGS